MELQNLEQFFDYNIEIKIMIATYPDIYTQEDAIEYVDKMYKKLQDMEYMFTKILKMLGNDETLLNYLKKLFTHYEKELLNTHYDPKKLKEFYQNCISNMNPNLIQKINTQIKGYYLFSNYQSCFLDCITINELLHVLHTYIVNTESFYERMPVIAKKEDEAVGTITLYGRPSILAETIFNSLDFNINSSIIDILSLNNNRILIMARDLGHALTIEIEATNNLAHVSYFIPKVCNIDMVNKLKGITPIKVDENTNLKELYAKGSFEVPVNELIPNLTEFMMNVPKDEDMFLEGGILANRR